MNDGRSYSLALVAFLSLLCPVAALRSSVAVGASSARPQDDVTPDARADKDRNDAERYLKRLAERSKAIRSLHVRFRQEKLLRILRRPRTSEGELWYAAGALSMKVRRQGEVESHLLVKDGVLRILYPGLARLETMELRTEGGPRQDLRASIPFLTGDWDAAAKDYDVKLRSGREETSDRVVLELVPRDPRSPLKRIRMVIAGDRLREYSQEGSSGDSVRMEILSWEENVEIAPERFRMDVPEGTKTVRLR